MQNIEVRIGDYFQLKEYKAIVKIKQVSKIYFWAETLNGNDIQGVLTQLEPVELTGEILEDNSFKKWGNTNLDFDYAYEDKDFSCYINLKTTPDKRTVIYLSNHDSFKPITIEVRGRNIKSLNVHQLQHAFTDAGLLDMDELFTIKKKEN